MANHKHLRTVIEDIHSNGDMLTKDLLLKLINEFKYSNLYIPAKKENGTLNFIIYEDEDAKITPLFTDMDEFRKFGTPPAIIKNCFGGKEGFKAALKSLEEEIYKAG